MVVIFNKRAHEEVLACLVKIRFLFHDDPMIRNADDLEQVGFAKFFSLGNGAVEFKDLIKTTVDNFAAPAREKTASRPAGLPESEWRRRF